MKNNLLSKFTFHRFYLIGFLIILTLPLLAIPPYFWPACWGKVIIFRSVLAILAFIFILQFLFKRESIQIRKIDWKSIKTLPLWLLLTLFFVYLLATIFSADPFFSFWGSPFRSEGFLNFAFFVAFSLFIFLILKERDWQKIWDFSILIGVLVALFGICQYFGLFPNFLVSFEGGSVPSTTGYTGFFAIYLFFLLFLTLSFGLKEKNTIKKVFYFLAALLFIFGIFISGARAVYLGLLIGVFYFFFFYPKKLRFLKIAGFCFLILAILVIYYLNTNPEIPQFIKNSEILTKIFSYLNYRLSLKAALFDLTETRFSAWKIGLQAIKEKPILGWGPENFQIGFDKHYDPSLPQMINLWWDRAHNFLIEYATTAGIPFLIVYLLLVGVLFFQLQRLKKRDTNIRWTPAGGLPVGLIHTNDTNSPIIPHGIQAAFVGYLVAMLFSFDGFVTHLLFFLLIAYALFLTAERTLIETQNRTQKYTEKRILWKSVFASVLFCVLIWFIWSFNIKPLKINSQIVIAGNFVIKQECDTALIKIESVLPQKSILDAYIRVKYLDFIKKCSATTTEKDLEYAQKGVNAMKETIKIQPTYTRAWLLLGGFTNVLINQEKDSNARQQLIKGAYSYFETAEKLSPRRPEIFIEWAKTDFLAGNYQTMREKSEKCLDYTKNMAGCYWFLGLSQIFLGEEEKAKENLETAKQKGYPYFTITSLNQLAKAYTYIKNYKELAIIYDYLISFKPLEFQYHASLAFVYRELGEFEKARKEALKVLELKGDDPEIKAEVELFLKTLPR